MLKITFFMLLGKVYAATIINIAIRGRGEVIMDERRVTDFQNIVRTNVDWGLFFGNINMKITPISSCMTGQAYPAKSENICYVGSTHQSILVVPSRSTAY